MKIWYDRKSKDPTYFIQMGIRNERKHSPSAGSHSLCRFPLTLLIKIRRRKTATSPRSRIGFPDKYADIHQYRLQKSTTWCRNTVFHHAADFYQIPGHSIITDKWMITIALIVKVKGSAFLSAVCIKKSGIQIQNNSLWHLNTKFSSEVLLAIARNWFKKCLHPYG